MIKRLTNLVLGDKYSKRDLKEELQEEKLNNRVGGIFYCENSDSNLLFVTLEKENMDDNHRYKDYFEDDYFHWDSQNRQHIGTPGVQKIIGDERDTHLFVRINKRCSVTCPFIYCGRLKYYTYDKNSSNPVHITFRNIDFDKNTNNKELIDIYSWQPNK